MADGIQTLDTVQAVGSAVKNNWWAGLSAAELKQVYKEIYDLGTLSKAHYLVEIEPINPSLKLNLLSNEDGDLGWAVPWLATSFSSGLLDAQTDSVNIGHFQQNFITGNGSNEVQVTFLETASADVLNTVADLKSAMFHEDGTQGLPYEYLLNMTVKLFQRNDRKSWPVVFSWVVALSAAQLDLESSDRDPLTVPLTFVKMYPMMEKPRA
jgi:hypothetical protein